MIGICGSSRIPGARSKSLADNRRGAMLVFAAIAMITLLGFLAMTLDVGAGNRQRRIAQTAADAGALGGASEIKRLQYDSVVTSARNEAVRNGFAVGDITVNYPPASGPHAGSTLYVEVLINKTVPTIFGSIFNIGSLDIAARAVAGVGVYNLTCLYTLDPSAPRALEVDNGGELDTNCGIAVNSTNPNALDTHSSGDVNAGRGSISVAGGWTGNKAPVPAPSTGTAAVVNPVSYLAMPTVGSCTSTGLLTITKDTTISPGVYCGGISVTNKTTNLSPGTYIIRGGGLNVRGGKFYGTGVTIINSVDTTGTYAFAPVYFGNGCQSKLTPSTSGDFAGVLIYGDPAGSAGAVNTFACASDVPPELTGIIYFPNQEFFFNGSNSGTELQGTIIAQRVEIGGKVTISLDTTGSTAVKRFSLVE